MVEIEIDGEGIALGRIHLNGSGAGRKVFGGEIKLQSGAGECAAAFVAEEKGLAGRREWFKVLVFAGNLDVEILPEIVRARNETFGGTGARAGGAHDIRAIRISELDLDDDSYEFGLIAMVKGGLLGAVAGRVLAGLLDEKSERSEDSDGGDVRAGFRRL